MSHEVRILKKHCLNHDVIEFHLEKPSGYVFNAGQAIELTIAEPSQQGPAPFTFTGLNSDITLQLIIKIYREHNGITAALEKKEVGDTVVISDPWDSFINKGPGIFLAGGAGITPFIALLRQLAVDKNIGASQLFFANKTDEDVFLQKELKSLLGNHYIDIITRDNNGTGHDILNEDLIKQYVRNFTLPFYVCGPPGFMDAVQAILTKAGASNEMVNVSF
ncbi:MAG TPA: flavodoxin reductase [Chryseosolibacter sp.]|nr:flavodoxin reductase [Chryseosolibacter sp.]